MSNYKIVNDEKELKRFINWLPDLNKNEKFYFSLFARKKYCQDLIKSNDKTQLYRDVSNKEDLFKKFKQLERPLGNWTLKNTEAPQESLVLYMMPNPRDLRKAAYMASMKLQKLVYENATNYNPVAETLGAIQKSKSRSFVVDFDIDSKDFDLNQIKKILPQDTYLIIETKGGYHILVNPQKANYKINQINDNISRGHTSKIFYRNPNWHQAIRDFFPCDQAGDQLLPVPGCIQGNFVPKIVKL